MRNNRWNSIYAGVLVYTACLIYLLWLLTSHYRGLVDALA